ncbi:MAG: cytochrome c peroxidase [Methylomonas sp.]|jgi:cytochrome c peroxidase
MQTSSSVIYLIKLPIYVLTGLLMSMPFGLHAQTQTLSLPAQVGKKLFFDTNLSASGKMACSTCHDPNNHYAQPATNNQAVQLGGPNLNLPGFRAVPTLTYKENVPAYSDNAVNPDGVSLNGPGGGFFWDGRADTLADQASGPLLSPFEMANASQADVVRKIQNASYASLFIEAYGADVFNDTQTAFNNAMAALQAFQLEDVSFHPYSSKFDLYTANKIGGDLTASEARGFQVFQNQGNCNACHYSGPGFNGSVAQFTDFSFEAIGVPRNIAIPANTSRLGLPSSFDLGICHRADHPPLQDGNSQFCGMFKTPTLRNVAARNVFFHNGVITSLSQALQFYNTRDTNPELWYPTVNGVVQKFNDLPAVYRVNIDPQLPLDGRAPGSETPMTEEDLQDLEAFLNTLTDGYQPPAQ